MKLSQLFVHVAGIATNNHRNMLKKNSRGRARTSEATILRLGKRVETAQGWWTHFPSRLATYNEMAVRKMSRLECMHRSRASLDLIPGITILRIFDNRL